MIQWIADPSRQAEVTAVAFLVSAGGTFLTLAGLTLTFYQVKKAAITAQRIEKEIDDFEFRRAKSDAVVELGAVKSSLESAMKLIKVDSWKDALYSYDEARKAVTSVILVADDLSIESRRKLKAIREHINLFCVEVETALADKGKYPDKVNLSNFNRTNFDDMTLIQSELQRLSR